MKVLFDGEIFSLQPFGGVNRYFTSLISGLPNEISPVIISSKGHSNDLRHARLKWHTFPRFAFRPGRLAFLMEQLYFNLVTKLSDIKVIHPTYYYLLLGRGIKFQKKPIVVTLYDLIHEIYPSNTDPKGHHAAAKKEILKIATNIICISHRTRQDLIELYPEFEKKSIVIPLAPDPKIPTLIDNLRPIDQPYFLFVGQRRAYKNFDLLLNAFVKFTKKFPAVKLLLSGPALEYCEIEKLSQKGLGDKVIYSGISTDSNLATLYKHSLALVYPSLYEGFGLPPLEAMLCGAPVICSSSSSMPEVVGKAAILFDPRSEVELELALQRIFESAQLRNDLIELGAKQVEKYSLDKMINSTYELYKKIV